MATLNVVVMGISDRGDLTLKYALPNIFLIVTHGCRDRQKYEKIWIAEKFIYPLIKTED